MKNIEISNYRTLTDPEYIKHMEIIQNNFKELEDDVKILQLTIEVLKDRIRRLEESIDPTVRHML